jgi:hypothetical protein
LYWQRPVTTRERLSAIWNAYRRWTTRGGWKAVKAAIEKLRARTYSANTGEFEAMKPLATAVR